VLRYRAPEIACAAVLELVGPSAAQWSVIDLGCGTGLCGPLIRHAARRLVGVDLSAAMLEKARAKGVYDELVQGDAVEVLARHADAFDVALCTDVMIYVGSLAPMFSAAGGALRPGALLAFTTEVHPGDGFVVDRTRRYRHSRGYVEQELARHGFALARVEPIVARYQSGEPDVQNLFVARR
jgi:predicted TPR repeat methyltransferase